MSGCAPVFTLGMGFSQEPSVHERNVYERNTKRSRKVAVVTAEDVAVAVQRQTEAKQVMDTFQEACKLKRHMIVTHFDKLRAEVDRTQRAALCSFDADVCNVTKRLEMECEALEVTAQQLAACLTVGEAAGEQCLQREHVPIQQPKVDCDIYGLQLLQRVVAQCWRTSDAAANSLGESELKYLEMKEEALGRMQEQLTAEQTEVRRRQQQIRLNEMWKPMGIPFAGKCVATFDIEIKAGGIAVSPDGFVLAISDRVKHAMTLVAMPSGNIIGSFGTRGDGPGQFHTPFELCFCADGTKILVVDLGNNRIQEVTLTGEHVRFLRICGRPCGVDANADVIVCSGNASIHVFDYRTGELIRNFQTRVAGQLDYCFGLKLMKDGTRLAVCDSYNRRVSVFTVTGEYVSCFSVHREANSIDSISFLHSGEIVISGSDDLAISGTSILQVYSSDGSVVNKEVILPTWSRTCCFGDHQFAISNSQLSVFI